ncbi:hypothetical protein BOX15_Mlig005489g1, partial [Macrostomum lignano]
LCFCYLGRLLPTLAARGQAATAIAASRAQQQLHSLALPPLLQHPLPGPSSLPLQPLLWQQCRLKSRHSSTKGRAGHSPSSQAATDDDEESDDEDEAGSDADMEFDELNDPFYASDVSLCDKFKVQSFTCKSLRAAKLASLGTGLSKSKVDQLCLQGRMYINGQKTIKKGAACGIGDSVSIAMSFQDDLAMVKQVRLLHGRVLPTGSYRIVLRCWKQPFMLRLAS